MRFAMIRSIDDLAALTDEIAFLPYFRSGIAGWSVEENIDPALWFTDEEGPWEWKGQLAFEKRCVYGKFIRGKAAFVSRAAFADLANHRRDGYDFSTRAEEGLASRDERLLMAYVQAHPGELSRSARRGCGVEKGYDGLLTRLQMQTYIVDQDFRYSVDKLGQPYGWGNAALITPEDWFGEEAVYPSDGCAPSWSFERLVDRIKKALPDVDRVAIERALR